MDIPRFVRRLSSYGLDENSSNPLAAVAPATARGAGLTVDTSVAKSLSFRKAEGEPQWRGDETTPRSQPSSTRSDDGDHVLRRRRSNSECLMLAKTNGTQDLPGPCKEYISSVKQILARSEERPAARRRSMSMRNSPINEAVLH